MNKKNLNMLDDYEKFKDAEREAKRQKTSDGFQPVFKVQKVNNKSSNESPENTSSEEQKNSSGDVKTQNNVSNTDSNTSTRPGTSYI